MSKVSVVVPVYNSEIYIERSITSLMEQTLDDVQFIIIDDGSTDNSLMIIRRVISCYPKREKQVILISRENRGVAITRAQGMSLATGDYLIHFDSDDWVELNWLEEMYSRAINKNADVVVCDYNEIYKGMIIPKPQIVPDNGVNCVSYLLRGMICNANWNKLVKRSIFEENNILFSSGINIGEDFLVTLEVFLHSYKVAHVNSRLYNYNRENESSLTMSFDRKSIDDFIFLSDRMMHLLKINGCINDPQIDNAASMFKMNIKNFCILKSFRNHIYKRIALDLYPETNRFICSSSASKLLRLTYYLHARNLGFLFFIVDFFIFIKMFPYKIKLKKY